MNPVETGGKDAAVDSVDFGSLRRRFGSPVDPLSRRGLLQGTLAMGMQMLLSDSEAKEVSSPRAKKRVVVVGAGLSGLACAHELAAIGYDVTVIEARDRIGGRVYSLHDLARGRVIEAGGEFIGSNHPLWLAYAHKFHLQLAEPESEGEGGAHPTILEGRKLREEEAKRLHKEIEAAHRKMTADARPILAETPWKSPNAEALDKKSIADWIAGLECSALCKKALRADFTGLNGVEPELQSYLAMLACVKGGGLERYWTDSEVYRCRGGNQQLASRLAEKIEALHLGLPVRRIQIADTGATVTCSNGRAFEADEVVLSVPPSVWKKIDISPSLPKTLQPQMGANIKYLAVVRKRFWRDHKMAPSASSDARIHSVWEGTALEKEDRNAVLTAFTGGQQAIASHRMQAGERDKLFQGALETFFPGFKENFVKARFIDWVGDPWTAGAYSNPAPGQVLSQGPILSSPFHKHLHFAGEHTCWKFIGYMEGALQSGVAVARRIATNDGLVLRKS